MDELRDEIARELEQLVNAILDDRFSAKSETLTRILSIIDKHRGVQIASEPMYLPPKERF